MSEFVHVADIGDVPDPGRILVEVDDRPIALFHVASKFYALDDVCTHDGGPLVNGELYGYEIACPRHGARFDIRDGQVLSMPATKSTASHEVRVDGERVMVRIKEEGTEAQRHKGT